MRGIRHKLGWLEERFGGENAERYGPLEEMFHFEKYKARGREREEERERERNEREEEEEAEEQDT